MRNPERGATVLAIALTSVLAIAFEVAVLANAEPLPPKGPIAAVLDRGIDAIRSQEHGAPAISVAVVRDGVIAYTYARGMADVATSTPITSQTRFRAGSLTKMFTALCVMQLVEAGRVGLDDSVSRYVADAPHGNEITVRELLSHSSGLPNFADAAFASGIVAQPVRPAAILAPLATQPLDFMPGASYEYSNTNYVILGLLVENVTGQSLADVDYQRILQPAGMTESSFGNAPDGVPLAIGYADGSGSQPIAPYDASWLFGSGDLVTTASDLARFDIALMDGKLISMQTLATMQHGIFDMGEGDAKYGLGFSVAPFGARTLAGHHGGIPGFAAEDEMIARPHFGVIVLGNSTNFYTSGVNRIVLSALFPTDFAAATAQAIGAVAHARASLDPAVEARARAFLSGVASGNLDRSTLASSMNDALTAQALDVLAKRLPAYDRLQSLKLMQHDKSGRFDVYTFEIDSGTDQVTCQFTFDPAGKLAGFFIR